MKQWNRYWIDFVGLSDGLYDYDFLLDESFFQQFENPIVEKGDLRVNVTFEKRPSWMALHFDIQGTIYTACDLCTEEFDCPIEGKHKLLVKFAEERNDEDPDVLYIEYGSVRLHIGHLLHEFVALSIPIRTVHPEDENGQPACDKEVLQYILSEEEWAEQEAEAEEDKPVDSSVWEVLQKLKEE